MNVVSSFPPARGTGAEVWFGKPDDVEGDGIEMGEERKG
jgi:hypothetical protein